ncbi:RNA polymerase, sigma-24 subunit, ECF subfamily [Pseudopedobacter saltans DSM 12145]|uniref:RNA polymerase, sigma-24 subunit, ECF subfamily n=1 Tax=Pseudopedobacter saltans (strain ATCC 51119 / DSM 12145 / JCM 21818 / CCUG 39354 / LMG 10337 / NBRC 100064 / NCIMB 13643) TaxID=762903 RepID=F0SA72_PSESL|nr:sigma-70 family RNA polymerase sigma factor [Pseudopedobacter saltans]ADY53636.1 RNA polymerase, sigma-24 subunit, ECF subfamily [Pseudopedobacter saltans DSM 12145]
MNSLKHIFDNVFKRKSSDEHSFRIFVNTYQDKVFRFISLFVKDSHVCEELMSDVFFSLWNKREQLEEVENLESYVFIIAKNKALNFLRKKKMELSNINDVDIDLFYNTTTNPESIYISQETIVALNKAIEELPTKTKLAFLMIRENEMKYKDAAEVLGVSVKTLEKQVAAAVAKLKEALQNNKDL